MKKLFAILICLFSIYFCFADKVPPEIEGELKVIYTKFTKASTVEEKAKYCLNPDLNKMRESWKDNKGYVPNKFGTCFYDSKHKVYGLIEMVQVNQLDMKEMGKFAYFKKVKNAYKLDWDAWICYNELTLKEFQSIKPEYPVEFRCFITKSNYTPAEWGNYDTYRIMNELGGWEFFAVASKNGVEKTLSEKVKKNEGKFFILKIKYDSTLKTYVITDVVQQWWTTLLK